jgi:hypothetical protein
MPWKNAAEVITPMPITASARRPDERPESGVTRERIPIRRENERRWQQRRGRSIS